MSDPVREIADMVTRIESGATMIDGTLVRNVYMMLGLHGRAATVEPGIRMFDEGTLRELASLMGQAGLVESLEEPGPRLITGTLWKDLVRQAFKPLFVPYTAFAVHFDGTARLSNTALNAADSPFYGFSFWLKFTGPSGGTNITFTHDAAALRPAVGFNQGASPAGIFSFWKSKDGLSSLEVDTNLVLTTGVWHHVLGAIDTNHPIGQKIGRIYIDGVLVSQAPIDFGVPFFNVIKDEDCYFAGTPGGDKQIADFADVRLAPGQNWLNSDGIVSPTIMALFRDAAGKPVDPAIATAALGLPAVLFTGGITNFPVNRGYGGPFTLTGTLTAASTAPTDLIVPPTIPTNIAAPVLTSETGTPEPGALLSCSTGDWTGEPLYYNYDWQEEGVSNGSTDKDWLPSVSSSGNFVRCMVTATNDVGTSEPQESNTVMIA